MPAPSPMGRRRTLGIIAAISAITAVGVSLSASLPLLAITLHSQGVSEGWIGINTAFAGVAAIAVTPFCSRIAKALGTPQALLACILVAAVSLPLFYIAPFWMWFVLRIIFHGAVIVAFVLSEFWINALAPENKRGLVMGIYSAIYALGCVVGPMIMSEIGTVGFTPFIMAGALIGLGAIPILFGLTSGPEMEEEQSSSFISFLFIAPVATLAGFAFGAVGSSALSLLPLFGIKAGFTAAQATLLISFMYAGNILLQIPIGLLADRFDRRYLLFICSSVGAVGAVGMMYLTDSYLGLACLLFFWGGLNGGLYTIGLTHLGHRFKGADLASANAAFVMMYSFGLLFGPATTGFAMKAADGVGLPLTFALIMGSYAIICLLRTIMSERS
ncbi:MFS transporter [Rhodobacteraceae bacterium RKSG542]|nr:MFS transporter [Pseudovibrio flavus]